MELSFPDLSGFPLPVQSLPRITSPLASRKMPALVTCCLVGIPSTWGWDQCPLTSTSWKSEWQLTRRGRGRLTATWSRRMALLRSPTKGWTARKRKGRRAQRYRNSSIWFSLEEQNLSSQNLLKRNIFFMDLPPGYIFLVVFLRQNIICFTESLSPCQSRFKWAWRGQKWHPSRQENRSIFFLPWR